MGSKEFINATTYRLYVMHVFIYLCAVLYTVFTKAAGTTKDMTPIVALCVVYSVSLLLDVIIIRREAALKKAMITKIFLEMGALAGVSLVFKFDIAVAVAVLLVQMFLYLELLVFDITDDTFILFVKKVVGGLIITLSVFAVMGLSVDTYHIIMSVLCAVMMVVICIVISDYTHGTVAYYDKIVGTLDSNNENLLKENANLRTYQEKVHHVNNEINFQKINLAKANSDLKALNSDIETLVNIMKNVSLTRDVEECMDILLSQIMDDRKPDICAFYIKENAFIDNEAYKKVKVAQDGRNSAPASNLASEKLFNLCIAEIFETAASREDSSYFPLIVDGNKTEFCPDYDLNMHNLFAFPAYLANEIYGVLVVGDRSDNFFDNGYTFYESAVVNLSAALGNIRFYLKMQDMARRDGLTGIYNRAYFNEIYHTVEKETEENNTNLSVAMLDIDKFKSVNDTYGHLAGDAVIKMVANVIHQYAHEYSGTACRYGGEEFVLILPGRSVDEAYDIMRKAHKTIRNTVVNFEQYEIHVNTSVGLSSYPATRQNVNELLNRSDEAMYYAKEHGRGAVIIDGREEETLAMKKDYDIS